MTKERMIELLDEQIRQQSQLVIIAQGGSTHGGIRVKEEHQNIRKGLVLAKLTLSKHWKEALG